MIAPIVAMRPPPLFAAAICAVVATSLPCRRCHHWKRWLLTSKKRSWRTSSDGVDPPNGLGQVRDALDRRQHDRVIVIAGALELRHHRRRIGRGADAALDPAERREHRGDRPERGEPAEAGLVQAADRRAAGRAVLQVGPELEQGVGGRRAAHEGRERRGDALALRARSRSPRRP